MSAPRARPIALGPPRAPLAHPRRIDAGCRALADDRSGSPTNSPSSSNVTRTSSSAASGSSGTSCVSASTAAFSSLQEATRLPLSKIEKVIVLPWTRSPSGLPDIGHERRQLKRPTPDRAVRRRPALSHAHAVARLDLEPRHVLAQLTRETPRQPDRSIGIDPAEERHLDHGRMRIEPAHLRRSLLVVGAEVGSGLPPPQATLEGERAPPAAAASACPRAARGPLSTLLHRGWILGGRIAGLEGVTQRVLQQDANRKASPAPVGEPSTIHSDGCTGDE